MNKQISRKKKKDDEEGKEEKENEKHKNKKKLKKYKMCADRRTQILQKDTRVGGEDPPLYPVFDGWA